MGKFHWGPGAIGDQEIGFPVEKGTDRNRGLIIALGLRIWFNM